MHTISASFALLLPFVGCSSHENKQLSSSHNIMIKQHKYSHETFDIALHGILLWASMGFLMPPGILIIRMSRFKVFYYVHASFQVISVLLATAAAVISLRKFENAFSNCHQRVGLALYGATYVQVLTGFRRPKRGNKSRKMWYFFHWILGTTISFVGIFNTYTGLKAYHIKTSKAIHLWTILFTAQVSFMVFFYLFQDKWDYIQKQGVIVLDNIEPNTNSVQIITQGDNKEEAALEPRRKSNSLGTYFSRSNALNKLFQSN